MVGCGVVSRACGYCKVALGSEGGGPLAIVSGEPSSRQKLRASSVEVRLHWGQRFMLRPRFLVNQIIGEFDARAREVYTRRWMSLKWNLRGPDFSSSLRVLCDLGVSAVNNWFKYTHRRDAESAKVAQRTSNQDPINQWSLVCGSTACARSARKISFRADNWFGNRNRQLQPGAALARRSQRRPATRRSARKI